MFSVVIPTLQKSEMLPDLVRSLQTEDLVGEILVINNAQTPLMLDGPKLRILDQTENIFVNPAWNLGAEEAACGRLAILNDDILLPSDLFRRVSRLMDWARPGIVGMHRTCFAPQDAGSAINRWSRATPLYKRTYGFGTAMFMERRNFRPIPDPLKIFCGDDWLFYSQSRRNWALRHVRLHTEMSTTAGAPRFVAMGAAEEQWLAKHAPRTYLARHGWEREALRLPIGMGLRIGRAIARLLRRG